MEKIGGVYFLENLLNHKVYIGSTNDLRRRQVTHLRHLSSNKHDNPYLQRAWKKGGKQAFCFWVIEIINDQFLLASREQFYLDMFWDHYEYGVYNCLRIAKDISSKLSNAFKDQQLSSEHKRKISETLKGRSEEIRARLIGRKLSEETKAKMRQSHKRYWNKKLQEALSGST
jgi:group I intron endonuclease